MLRWRVKKVFILSPANAAGERAALIYNPRAQFDLARRLRQSEGVPLAEVFSFLSGLYFRGKFTYARKFANPPKRIPGVVVITSNCGLVPAETRVTVDQVRAFSGVPIDPRDSRYLGPLERDAALLGKVAGPRCRFVLLGSVGTKKYVEVLLSFFRERLLFPPAFVGRGDMSRGGLLLRCAAEDRELDYAPLAGAVRHGTRPPRLEPRRWGFSIFGGTTNT